MPISPVQNPTIGAGKNLADQLYLPILYQTLQIILTGGSMNKKNIPGGRVGTLAPANLLRPASGTAPHPRQATLRRPPKVETLPSATSTAAPTNPPLPATATATAALPTQTTLPTETPLLSPTLSPTPIDFPTIAFKTNANCRLGPSTNYNQVTTLSQTAPQLQKAATATVPGCG